MRLTRGGRTPPFLIASVAKGSSAPTPRLVGMIASGGATRSPVGWPRARLLAAVGRSQRHHVDRLGLFFARNRQSVGPYVLRLGKRRA